MANKFDTGMDDYYLGKEPKNSALKRRMERNLAKNGIPGLKSKEAFYLIEPEKLPVLLVLSLITYSTLKYLQVLLTNL